METKWIGCASDNYRKDRPPGMKPEMIVLHSLDGSLADADARFNRPGANLSAHYAVGLNGEIRQYLLETDTAFHAGYVINPTARLVKDRPKVNPNFYSIGIEHEGKPGDPPPPAQTAASAALIRDVAARWGIPLDRHHVIGHGEIRASANCPGPALDIAALLATPASEGPPAASITMVTLRCNVNLRSRPSVSAPVVRVVPEQTSVAITGFVQGDTVNGNPFWCRDRDGNYFWAGATDRPDPEVVDQQADSEATTDIMNRQPPVIDRSSFRLAASQFYQDRYRKDLIVLHFTAGTDARSAFEHWASNAEHIATAYIVHTDGAIYEIFDPSRWAYHMGIKGTYGRHDKRSIGIEIANVGPLRPSAHDASCLNWWWPKNFGIKFCSVSDTDKYVKTTYRNEHYFAAFPEVQVVAVRDLVTHLCESFSIPKVLPPSGKQFMCDLDYFNGFSGVASHANFRRDKWDIGPAFGWKTLGIENAPA